MLYKSLNINYLYRFCSMLLLIVGLGACSTTMESMEVVNQNLDEGRLVPGAAVAVPDILNQYTFAYSEPSQAAAGVQIELDRRQVFTAGSTLMAQLALTTRRARPAPFHLHLLVYDESIIDKDHRRFVESVVRALQKKIGNSATPISLSVDSNYRLADDLQTLPALSKKRQSSLKDFLGDRGIHAWDEGTNHFLLLLGSIRAMHQDTQQDITDIGRLFAARNSKLSVISYGEKPDFAVLKNLAQRGHGYLHFNNEFLNLNDVLQTEFDLVHAYKLENIHITIAPLAGASIEQVLSPQDTAIDDGRVSFTIPEMLSGQQYVTLLKIKVPPISKSPHNRFLEAKLSYFNSKTQKYASARGYASINYSMDINETLPSKNTNIARSRLILATQDTIQQAAGAVRQGRNYMAIAEITKQRHALKDFLSGKQDRELDRDVKILDKFVANLHDFDQSWFQRIKIWKDMNWDNNRFSARYE